MALLVYMSFVVGGRLFVELHQLGREGGAVSDSFMHGNNAPETGLGRRDE